ncbi:MAG: hypothetical protein NWR72_19930, partial [Bacteroidia bacterium]|nr:hypothetical protein [Bacteroidia bacterium]
MRYLLLAALATLAFSGCQKLTTLEVNSDYCSLYMLPLMQFSVSYPADLEPDLPTAGMSNMEYLFLYKTDTTSTTRIQTESIAFGALSLSADSVEQDKDMEVMIGKLEENYSQAGFELEDSFTGIEEFDGKEYRMFRATGTIDREEYELQGRYRILILIIKPEFHDNGLIISMMARDDSPIQSYEDFANKGSISKAWSSLEI